jgi:hypothetical protein
MLGHRRSAVAWSPPLGEWTVACAGFPMNRGCPDPRKRAQYRPTSGRPELQIFLRKDLVPMTPTRLAPAPNRNWTNLICQRKGSSDPANPSYYTLELYSHFLLAITRAEGVKGFVSNSYERYSFDFLLPPTLSFLSVAWSWIRSIAGGSGVLHRRLNGTSVTTDEYAGYSFGH